ncbi:ZIP family metal transporter [Sphingobacterium lactis]|uniref:ZIP family metal transporter n=1 Tax=Sphingobacterium lactis TaxID=797291 RepID=UPI003DA26708
MLEELVAYLGTLDPVVAALFAGLFTWGVTALGASGVFLFKGVNKKLMNGMLGFTGGVMIAASFWSLLSPAIEMSSGDKFEKVMPAAIGFILGALFIFGLDKLMPHLHLNFLKSEGPKSSLHRTTLLTIAIALHNIPEGLAVGVLFGAAASGAPEASISGAVLLAMGIGLQNFPEGIAVSMPLRRMGLSKWKSFQYGQLSAIVEPIFAVLGAFAVGFFMPVLPYALAFAAGAMLFVVIEEVIPETQQEEHSDIPILGFVLGFVIMMVLDVALG